MLFIATSDAPASNERHFSKRLTTLDLAHYTVTDRRLYNTLAPLSKTGHSHCAMCSMERVGLLGSSIVTLVPPNDHVNGNTVGVKKYIYIPIHVLEMMMKMDLFVIIQQLNTRYTTKIHSKISLHDHIHNGLEQLLGGQCPTGNCCGIVGNMD